MTENIVVLESDGQNPNWDDDMQIDNPQEPLYYIPLTHGRTQLPLKERIALLRQEIIEIDKKLDAEIEPERHETPYSYISELASMTSHAESLIRGQGIHIEGDIGIEGNLSSKLGKSMIKLLTDEEQATYQLTAPIPQSTIEAQDREIATLASISARISKLEETIGHWSASNGYYSIIQALALIKKRISMLNPKKLEQLSSQAEELNAELDMVRNQLELMQSAGVEQKVIDDIYPFVDVCDQVMPIVPEVLERLEYIKRVHDEGSRFNERIQEIRDRQSRIQEKLNEVNNEELRGEWEAFKQEIEESFGNLEIKIRNI
ncbi:unnamed protein product [Blepharisma stoltei]|uniref:Dynactin subunit 2 n=1 Tax=Blepharisma stoltei TaxID=1481888 RepID=A0AAU9JRS7_9CILI|nr:unnamed protein product [Blepharisma stoltei]